MRHLISHAGPLIMLSAGLFFSVGAVTSLDLGSFRRMGPGAFPLLVGGLLCLLALIGLVQNLRHPLPVDHADPVAVLGVTGGVVGFALLTPLLGVLPATFIAVLTTAAVIPGFRWPMRLALAAGVAVGVWLIFVLCLGIPFTAIKGI
ncbi:tripartite tricarboxylate transporter TctB family protein [Paracoccus sp. Z330]|uniref:Tripartite tricarboxylate transporter TctB family protein n=1 Tax=Paracoccus onchidii TaxID=3017813 RepID=A0ABT4ZIG3_9RHOB|nr:tripartite tricarboxylate transporter TctB family protein [Paracoccus onchidii]MDB6179106.1 tripartite tricarboxylate transporter TctB family protein [Paracoccus onchidii]